MAQRVRKLAKQLGRSPWDVLGVLHAMGYVRYRSPEDMLPDSMIVRLRKALEAGTAPIPVPGAPPPGTPVAPRRAAGRRDTRDDLMSRLVPGVVRTGSTPAARAAAPAPVVAPRAETRPAPGPSAEVMDSLARTLESERAALEAQRSRLHAERTTLGKAQEALQAERAGLDSLRWALDREREALDEERAAFEALRATVDAAPALPTLVQLLEARGLRGMDEVERALAALAGPRSLRDVLWCLQVTSADVVQRVLQERLVLVAGAPPPALGRTLAAVRVSADRAEVPDAAELQQYMERLGEQFLLNGIRRVLVVGGRALSQRMLRDGIDSRVELRFQPPRPRTAADAEADVARTDAIVLWDVAADADALRVYASSRAALLRVEGRSLPSLFAVAARVLGDAAA